MQSASNNLGSKCGGYFICLSCLLLIVGLIAEFELPVQARRTRWHASKSTILKKNQLVKPAKKNTEAQADTTKQFYQDVTNLGRAYALYDLGLNEYLIGDYGLASEHLGSAEQIFSATYGVHLPQQETFFFDLALAQEGAGNLDAAVASYNKSLLHAGFFDGYLGLAQLYGRMGKWQEGSQAIRKALDLRPDDPRANLIYGLILEKQGQLAEAETFKTKAREFVSIYGLAGVKNTADKEIPEAKTNPEKDNLPGVGAKDLELP